MDVKKQHRQSLRRRLYQAEYTIFRRNGWSVGVAHTMAKDKVNAIASEIAAQERKVTAAAARVATATHTTSTMKEESL